MFPRHLFRWYYLQCKKREHKGAQAWGDIKVLIEIVRVSIEAVQVLVKAVRVCVLIVK
jgi:hypothetical protein